MGSYSRVHGLILRGGFILRGRLILRGAWAHTQGCMGSYSGCMGSYSGVHGLILRGGFILVGKLGRLILSANGYILKFCSMAV